MRSGRGVLGIAIFFMVAVLGFSCFLKNAEAFRGAGAIEGPRGGETVEGPRGGKVVEGPRGNTAVEGPRGNVAVGTRFNSLPDSASSIYVGDRSYYVDGSGVYYLPCPDDGTVYCVVSAPR